MADSVAPAAIDRLINRWVEYCAGGMAVGLAYLGHRLGLFDALREAGSVTSVELAARTGLVERYVREWLAATSASGLVHYSPADERYTLTPEQENVFADPDSVRYLAPMAVFVLKNLEHADDLVRAFREGGGVPFAAYGPLFTKGMDDISRPVWRAKLATDWLQALPGAVEKLAGGGAFLDVGCGGGLVCVEVARAFPSATVTGVDRHGPSIERAWANAREAGVAERARFEAIRIEQLPSDARFDVVTTFDVIHDQVDPVGVLRRIRALLDPDGSYMMVEGNDPGGMEDDDVQLRLRYGASMFHCLPQSLAEGGVGLGAVLSEAAARELALQAGFSTFRALPIEDPARAFYHLAP